MYSSTEFNPSKFNPILGWFRVDSVGLTSTAGTGVWLTFEESFPTEGSTPEHREHARKVLTKWVNIYGGGTW